MDNTYVLHDNLNAVIDTYYSNVIGQLQSNYGNVQVRTDAPTPQSKPLPTILPRQQSIIETKQRELHDTYFFLNSAPSLNTPASQSLTGTTPIDCIPSFECQPPLESLRSQHDMAVSGSDASTPSAMTTQINLDFDLMQIRNNPNDVQLANSQLVDMSTLSDSQKYIGKGLYLGRAVEEGDVVFAERPITSLNTESQYVRTCAHCLRPLGTIQEQLWTMLMHESDKTAINPEDVLELIQRLEEFIPSIAQYNYLSGKDDDGDDVDDNDVHKNDTNQSGNDSANINSVISSIEQRLASSSLHENEYIRTNKDAVIRYYQSVVLQQYNLTLRQLRQQEIESSQQQHQQSTSTTTTTTTTTATTSSSSSTPANELLYTLGNILDQAIADQNEVLDLNVVTQHNIFPPHCGLAQVTPVFNPYTFSSYCSIRCMCQAFNDYDHILIHAYPSQDPLRLKMQQLQIEQEAQKHEQQQQQQQQDQLAQQQHTASNASHTFNPNLPGALTLSNSTPAPSGLPFLQTSRFYQELKFFSAQTNPMFLAHSRSITQALAQYGMHLVHHVGGHYTDVMSLLAIQGQYSNVNAKPYRTELVDWAPIVDLCEIYDVTKRNNINANSQMVVKPEADDSIFAQIEQLTPQHPAEQQVRNQFDTLLASLTSKVPNTPINATIQKHSDYVADILSKLNDKSYHPSEDEQQTHVTTTVAEHPFQNATPNTAQRLFASFHHECYCSDCVAELSYLSLQQAFLPFLLFTQTQWWTHLHDENGQNFFEWSKSHPGLADLARPRESMQDSDDDDGDDNVSNQQPSLFESQFTLLAGLMSAFKPIIASYATTLAMYLSCITRQYPCCLRRALQARRYQNGGASTSVAIAPKEIIVPAPYFIDIIASTPDCHLHEPYSRLNACQTMNDIPNRVRDFAMNIQRPMDTAHWHVLSHFVAMCELNNIAIPLKTGCEDVREFMTVHNLHELDGEDLEAVEDEIQQMFYAAVSVYIQSHLSAFSLTQEQTNQLEQTSKQETDITGPEHPYGINIALAKQILATHIETFPVHLRSSDSYLQYVLACTKSITSSPGSSTTAPKPKASTLGAKRKVALSGLPKAWQLLNKRAPKHPEGNGLFRVACTMNHSCDPNIAMIPINEGRSNLLAAVAVKDIAIGEELRISYIDIENAPRYRDRKDSLKDYQFVCECPKCTKDLANIRAKQQAAASGTGAKSKTVAKKSVASTKKAEPSSETATSSQPGTTVVKKVVKKTASTASTTAQKK